MIDKKEHSFELDWYMLGITIYELIHKKTPFTADTVEELQKKIITEQAPTLKYVSAELQHLLLQLLEKKPEGRIGRRTDSKEIK
jgi:serine/threonine protein kinase